MKSFALTTSAAILGLIGSLSGATAHGHEAPNIPGKEKCYGIAKAGKNDCGWSGGSCAGSSKTAGNTEAWMFLPTGSCNRIDGGSLKPYASNEAPLTEKERESLIKAANPISPVRPQPIRPTPVPPVSQPAPETPVAPTTPVEPNQLKRKAF